MPKAPESELALGWKVNKQFEPQYWVNPAAAPGQHQPSDLVRVPASAVNNHMVIVAQSGSGKSFFLGRIVEELLLQTGSRVVIFDPNSDFRSIGDFFEPEFWSQKATPERKTGYGYDRDKRRGFLPTETSREEFESKWKPIAKFVSSSLPETNDYHQKLQIDWPSISIDMLIDELDATLQTEVKHCHNFAQMISQLIILTSRAADKSSQNFLDVAKELCQATRGRTEQEVLFHIRDRFPATDRTIRPAGDDRVSRLLSLFRADFMATVSKRSVEELHQRATIHRSFISDTAERFYFSTAYAVRQSGLLRDGQPKGFNLDDLRLHVVDLPSINDRRFRNLIVSTLLDLEWERARRSWREALKKSTEEDDRVPTFIVVDEAHNLVPFHTDNPTELWLREKFRTIAAEGRKFGLYLVLVSQRPDKLDPIVLSECENKAVLRLGSQAVLAKTIEILSLTEIPESTVQECLDFDTGRALIVGAWVPQATYLYGAARRTKEGGRNLQAEHWAHPISLSIKSGLPVTAEKPDNIGEASKEAKDDEASSDEKVVPKEDTTAKPEN